MLDVHVADYPIIVLVDSGSASEGEHAAILMPGLTLRHESEIGQLALERSRPSRDVCHLRRRSERRAGQNQARSRRRRRARPLEAIAQATRAIERSESAVFGNRRPFVAKSGPGVAEIDRRTAIYHQQSHSGSRHRRREATAPGAAAPDALREVSELTHGQHNDDLHTGVLRHRARPPVRSPGH